MMQKAGGKKSFGVYRYVGARIPCRLGGRVGEQHGRGVGKMKLQRDGSPRGIWVKRAPDWAYDNRVAVERIGRWKSHCGGVVAEERAARVINGSPTGWEIGRRGKACEMACDSMCVCMCVCVCV